MPVPVQHQPSSVPKGMLGGAGSPGGPGDRGQGDLEVSTGCGLEVPPTTWPPWAAFRASSPAGRAQRQALREKAGSCGVNSGAAPVGGRPLGPRAPGGSWAVGGVGDQARASLGAARAQAGGRAVGTSPGLSTGSTGVQCGLTPVRGWELLQGPASGSGQGSRGGPHPGDTCAQPQLGAAAVPPAGCEAAVRS